jgi:hypothetical protein
MLDGTALCSAPSDQWSPKAVSDGAGGAIVAWADYRNGATADVYAQRINALGNVLWTTHGVAISTLANDQNAIEIVSDGAGGAIMAWQDFRGGAISDIYAQRINASGVVQWTANGVAMTLATGNQRQPTILADGNGGAFVMWEDYRNGATSDVYGQRVNGAGVVQWNANGVGLVASANDQIRPEMAPDGAGGAIVMWQDARSGTSIDIYGHRISAGGSVQWPLGGVPLCTAALDQELPKIVSDGSGGGVVVWEDERNGVDKDIYAQRISFQGAVQWATNGVRICGATSGQYSLEIASDGAGGAIAAWTDPRNGGMNSDIYAQRISVLGAIQWVEDGVGLCNVADNQYSPQVLSDGIGGAIVTWQDARIQPHIDLYAQRVNSYGAPQWTANGVPVTSAPNSQGGASLVSDGAQGAIAAWQDSRTGTGNNDIYAQRVEGRYGFWGRPEPILDSVTDNPNDQGGKVALNWRASGRDVLNEQTIYWYSIWRAIDEVAASNLASSGATTIVDTPVSRSIAPGNHVVWRERIADTIYYWELVASQVANYNDDYSMLVATRQDAFGLELATHYFRVVAEGENRFYTWPSNIMIGNSVDNLAPLAPLSLSAQRIGNYVYLRWNRAKAPDLRDYAIYRATSTGVTPVPINFVASSEDTLATDTNAPTSMLYYIVTAYDVHANQSPPSNEASVGALTDVGNTPAISALTVRQNQPNPFATTTEFQVGLPSNSDLSIEVFDVAGRRVRSQSLAQQTSGWQKIPFDGRDDGGNPLSSGVYFYKVTANGTTVTNKVVIAR